MNAWELKFISNCDVEYRIERRMMDVSKAMGSMVKLLKAKELSKTKLGTLAHIERLLEQQ